MLVAVCLCAFTCAVDARETLPPLSSHARILAFGDSLTDGVGGSGENYPERLARRIDRVVINAGSNGETTAQGRARLPGVLREERPALLILCLGINDLSRGLPRDAIRDNLVAMLASARDAGVPVLLLGLPARGGVVVDALFSEAAQVGDAVLDARSMVDIIANPALKADLVHLNADGYRQLSERLAEVLRQRGALGKAERG